MDKIHPQTNIRLANIQSLRGIAALLVVLSHLFTIEKKYSPDQFLDGSARLGIAGVDLFFAISGFIMLHIVWEKRRGIKSMFEFLFARITRIYPLYWLVTAAIVPLYFWRPEMVFSSISTAPNLIKSFLLIPDERYPLLLVGWTLIHEMGFYLVFSCFLLFKSKYILPALILWGGIILGAQHFNVMEHDPYSAILFSPLTFEFLGGAVAGWVFHKYGAPYARIALLLGGVLSAFVLYKLAISDLAGLSAPFGRALHFALPATLIVYGLAGLKTNLPKWTQTLGDWSYALYLTHVLTLTVLGRIWRQFAQESAWDNIPALIIMTLLSIVVAGITWKLFENPLHNLAKKLRARVFPLEASKP